MYLVRLKRIDGHNVMINLHSITAILEIDPEKKEVKDMVEMAQGKFVRIYLNGGNFIDVEKFDIREYLGAGDIKVYLGNFANHITEYQKKASEFFNKKKEKSGAV